MPPKVKQNSNQPARSKGLDPHFVRQLRNFMNNWVVEGGKLEFNGYRVKLRINRPAPASLTAIPWKITATGDLDVNVATGDVFSLKVADPDFLKDTVAAADLTLTASSTNYISLKLVMAVVAVEGAVEHFEVSSLTIQAATSSPTTTFDPTSRTGGDLYFELGQVVTDTDTVTSITQTLSEDIFLSVTALSFLSNPGTSTSGNDWVLRCVSGGASYWDDPDAECP